MDVITIESKAYHELMGKIEKILRYIEKEEKAKAEYENRLVTNDELAEILGISKRTLQRYRASGTLPFHIIYHKTWYLESEILTFMKAHFTENLKRKRKRPPKDT